MSDRYFAHSSPDGNAPPEGWEFLASHLLGVAALARSFVERVRPDSPDLAAAAEAAGLLHDVGKYGEGFQAMLRAVASGGKKSRVEHSTHGAVLACEARLSADVAFAVAGHHAGLPCLAGPAGSLRERCARIRSEAPIVLSCAKRDSAELERALAGALAGGVTPVHGSKLDFDLRTRLLFSCLVDADHLLTARHFEPKIETIRGAGARPLDPETWLRRLLARIETIAKSRPDGRVSRARRRVLEACLGAAVEDELLWSLTVPTGGGKTLASLAFALKHASLYPGRFDRVVVVLPYLSIIEQNAKVFREVLGEDVVLEHHSGVAETLEKGRSPDGTETYIPAAGAPDETAVGPQAAARRLAAENWDAPFIVTTSVRLFETLFSNRPSACRRLHRLARSIVILDEVQTLPPGFLAPTLSILDALARDYGTVFVFCTATQPAFERPAGGTPSLDPRWRAGTIREILRDPTPASLFAELRRVQAKWPARDPASGESRPSTWSEIATALGAERRALCIVNTRDHARMLFLDLRARAREAGLADERIFHLSTRMCPKHRLTALARIREALLDPESPCLVASTQLVEAGVDLDFPVVYRAMGPLDSIVQSAGRCDREGVLTQARSGSPGGRLVVFETEDGRTPAGVYRLATDKTRQLLRAADGDLRIDDPAVIRRYYESLYSGIDLDARDIQKWREQLDFPKVAEEFSLIADLTRPVLVPFDGEARASIAAMEREYGPEYFHLFRRVQSCVVGVYPREFDELRAIGAVRELREGSDIWVSVDGFYDERLGLDVEPSADRFIV